MPTTMRTRSRSRSRGSTTRRKQQRGTEVQEEESRDIDIKTRTVKTNSDEGPESWFWREKGAWIPPTTRDVLLSCRLWSVPASLMPMMLTAMVVHYVTPAITSFKRQEAVPWLNQTLGVDWMHFDLSQFLLGLSGGITAHLAANLINTFFDYYNGVDTIDSADDRTLVDRKVYPDTVAAFAIVCLTICGAVCGYFAVTLGTPFLIIASTGVTLAVVYTATPLQLKYRGLGDVTVFVCFGPLIMLGTALRLLYSSELECRHFWCIPGSIYVLSVAVGLLTVAILHANNTRDIIPDSKRGSASVAQYLTFEGNLQLYKALLSGAFVFTAVGVTMAHVEHSLRYNASGYRDYRSLPVLGQALIATSTFFQCSLEFMNQLIRFICKWIPSSTEHVHELTLAVVMSTLWKEHPIQVAGSYALLLMSIPWALRLASRFRKQALRTLPQLTAQFEVLFIASIGCSLLYAESIGRLFLGILYILGAMQNVIMWHHTSELVHYKLNILWKCGFPEYTLPRPMTYLAAACASVVQFVLSSGFILDVHAWKCALILSIWTCIVSVVTHDFWNCNVWEQEDIDAGEQVHFCGSVSSAGSVGNRTPSKRCNLREPPSRSNRHLTRRKTLVSDWGTSSTELNEMKNKVTDKDVNYVPVFPRVFDDQFVHFFKNMAMVGGLLLFLCTSSDQRLQN